MEMRRFVKSQNQLGFAESLQAHSGPRIECQLYDDIWEYVCKELIHGCCMVLVKENAW
jgi:hypothetical protein